MMTSELTVKQSSLRKTPFQEKHGVMYGLHVRSRDSKGEAVSVQCRFCVHFGREERQGRALRKTLTTIKVYVPPYRPENYRHHNATQHPKMWVAYQAMSPEDQSTFFAMSTRRSTALEPANPSAHADGASNQVAALSDHVIGMNLSKDACNQVQALKEALGDRYFDAVDMLTDATAARAFLVVGTADRVGWLQWRLARQDVTSSTMS
ncbi:hypothetical protein DYB37_013554 [Aphanomyces astaci]|uniref:Uncharacterized protein n=1 Tax=Aphanomyces astaci TaxID=112090 RepID=A0A397D8A8_APHAT|nr:hypothetical protein DYB30_010492 [Aphanomyces astaci]RHY57814.1 hypothetical protein DYB38_001365 [Aphanomyces astaci]RHY61875.1 hypothetical protein DYB34_007877 [Aphanomyces astaci]RHY94947.1 hypothetical protein DYB26_014738 [Aphanomyces astaci]RHY96742.1 hypothetical protein DYB35_005832 [Aphanomyces astaci]